MAEYALHDGERVKIGTCEEMYYLRAEQAHDVVAVPGSVDPVKHAEELRFRFPWPDEDGTAPGRFDPYNRTVALWGMETPAGLADAHHPVQFIANAGYLTSLPCPESGRFPADLHFQRNGFGGAVRLCGQRRVGDVLASIVTCGGCGLKWRLETLEDAAPALEALAHEVERATRQESPSRAEWFAEVARRLQAGYRAPVAI